MSCPPTTRTFKVELYLEISETEENQFDAFATLGLLLHDTASSLTRSGLDPKLALQNVFELSWKPVAYEIDADRVRLYRSKTTQVVSDDEDWGVIPIQHTDDDGRLL